MRPPSFIFLRTLSSSFQSKGPTLLCPKFLNLWILWTLLYCACKNTFLTLIHKNIRKILPPWPVHICLFSKISNHQNFHKILFSFLADIFLRLISDLYQLSLVCLCLTQIMTTQPSQYSVASGDSLTNDIL